MDDALAREHAAPVVDALRHLIGEAGEDAALDGFVAGFAALEVEFFVAGDF